MRCEATTPLFDTHRSPSPISCCLLSPLRAGAHRGTCHIPKKWQPHELPSRGPSPRPPPRARRGPGRRKPSVLLCAKARWAERLGKGPERTFQVWQESGPLVWQETGLLSVPVAGGIPWACVEGENLCVVFFSSALSPGGAGGTSVVVAMRGSCPWCLHAGLALGAPLGFCAWPHFVLSPWLGRDV